jgi:hypothetical protein
METEQGLPRIVGLLSVHWDSKRQKFIARAWPKKAGPPTQKQIAARAEFALVSALVKRKTARDYQAALDMTTGTAITWKDALSMACYGTLLSADGTNGRQYRSYRIVAEDVQTLLDSLTNIPGAIIVRTVDGWRGLAPGIDLQILTFNGLTGLPDWASVTPSASFDAWAVDSIIQTPAASDFTLVQNAGGTAALTDLGSGRGTHLAVPSTGISSMAMMQVAVPSQTSFLAEAMLMVTTSRGSPNAAFGIALTDSGGKVQIFGGRNVGAGLWEKADFRFSAMGTFNSSVVDTTFEWPVVVPVWLRLLLVSGNLVLYASCDGENFEQLVSVSKTVYLGATLSKIGPIFYLNASGQTVGMNCYSWAVG